MKTGGLGASFETYPTKLLLLVQKLRRDFCKINLGTLGVRFAVQQYKTF